MLKRDMTARFSSLRLVVMSAWALAIPACSLGKPDIANNIFASWAGDIDRLAKHSNVVCKFSGILNQAKAGWTMDALRPYADHVIRCFGAERLLWGSDWPPSRLTAEYDVVWKVAHELVAHLPAESQEMIFGGNATRIYRL